MASKQTVIKTKKSVKKSKNEDGSNTISGSNGKKKIETQNKVDILPSPILLEEKNVTKDIDNPAPQIAALNNISITPAILWGIAIALGLSFDFLFWEQLAGVNYFIFLGLCVIGGLIVLRSDGHKPAFNTLLLLIPLVFFAVFSFLRREPLTSFLAYALSLFSLGVFAVTYLGGKWYLYRLSTYIYKFFLLVFDMIGRPLGYILQTQKQRLNNGSERKGSPLWGLVRGLLISLPIVFCLGSLLASGDLVFNQKINEFFEDFTQEKILDNIQRVMLIAGCAYLAAGVFIHSLLKSKDEELSDETKSAVKPFMGFTETSVVLVSVSVLFILFVGVQFKYFFGGETNIGVTGYTYSQYARRGFNELITVAFISLMIVVGLRGVVRIESELQRRIYTGLNILLIGLVLIILVSAYQRISLGIDWHGYSRLRLYPKIFLIWLAILFIAEAVLITIKQERFFALSLVLATFGFASTISLINIDASTVRHNVYRAWHGKNLNVAHLASLSDDAIPALANEFLSPTLPDTTRDGVGAILACYTYFEDRPHISPYDWRSFNLSRSQAHEALEEIRPHLKGYVIKYDRHPVQVKTPTNVLYDCIYYPYRELEEEE
ncbi:MAG: DUF4173 domain-containing protein [Chloroflexi bacterium]|nr:DUF4173 domain-containing protein [Chloroflexota bacterium]